MKYEPSLTPHLQEAVLKGDVKKADALLKAGANPYALKKEADDGYQDPSDHELEKLQEKPDIRLVHVAAEKSAPILRLLGEAADKPEQLLTYRDWNGYEPVHRAARHGNVEALRYLHEKGISLERPNLKGFGFFSRPADEAALSGHVNVLQFLHEKGVDVLSRGKTGITPARAAVMALKVDVLKYLKERGLDVNERDKEGFTLLHGAVSRDHADPDMEKVIRFLHRSGANLDASMKDGTTPLMRAAEFGNPDAVRILLQLGANAELRDERGKTAAQMAKNEQIRNILGEGVRPEPERELPMTTTARKSVLQTFLERIFRR